MTEAVCLILENYQGEYAIQSFNPFAVQWVKDHYPEVTRGVLSGTLKGDDSGESAWYEKIVIKNLWL